MMSFSRPALGLIACVVTAMTATSVAAGPLVIAHRGGPAALPENTIPAFENAVRLGADMLEFDMNVTADDRIVLHHDNTVDSKTCVAEAGSGVTYRPIRELTLAQTQTFNCGVKHPTNFPNQVSLPVTRMPTLEQFLERFAGSGLMLLGETKMPPPGAKADVDPTRFAAQVAAAVAKYGVEKTFVLISNDYRTIDAIRKINPRISTCLLSARRWRPLYVALAQRHDTPCMVLTDTDVTEDLANEIKAAGIAIYGNTSDREELWSNYVKLGAKAIITNDPAGLIAYLKKAGLRK